MQKYLVFAGETYYALGGMHDFKKGFDDLGEAIAYGSSIMGYRNDWYHVVDYADGTIIASSETQAFGVED
jgi:hypothetical protein